jgi:hypothetical protein
MVLGNSLQNLIHHGSVLQDINYTFNLLYVNYPYFLKSPEPVGPGLWLSGLPRPVLGPLHVTVAEHVPCLAVVPHLVVYVTIVEPAVTREADQKVFTVSLETKYDI